MIGLLRKKFRLDTLNIINIFYIFISGFILFIFSNGNVRGITSDLEKYIIPAQNFFQSGCSFTECFNYLFPGAGSTETVWATSPFYSLFFLLPITIFNSDLLFLIQGLVITLLIFFLIKNLLQELYKDSNNKNIVSAVILIGFFNYYFIKDSLTSGTMSVCFLFILLGIRLRKYLLPSFFMIFFAAITRTNYIFISVSFIISLLITKPRNFKKYFLFCFGSIIIYIINYNFSFSSYPGGPLLGIFKDGMHSSSIIAEFFTSRIQDYAQEQYYWEPNIYEIVNLILNDPSILYGLIVNYIFKIMSLLGFMHYDFFIDERGLWFQRLINLLNFSIIYTPGFYSSLFIALLMPFYKIKIFSQNEALWIYFALIYVFSHALFLGSGRHLIGIHFIFIMPLIKIVFLLKESILNYGIKVEDKN